MSRRTAGEEPGTHVRCDTVIEGRPYSSDVNQRILLTGSHKPAFQAGRRERCNSERSRRRQRSEAPSGSGQG